MLEGHSAKRCGRCARPLARCLCASIPQVVCATSLVIIQHPSERHHALNTARLLAAGLVNAELHVVERICEDSPLHTRLIDSARCTRLLFPGPSASALIQVDDPRPHQLVLLDGTWRKARKLLHLNPVLRALQQVALPTGVASRYRLRKAPVPGALSTIEAGVAALEVLEPEGHFQPLLRPFDLLIEEQIQAMGEDRYRRNYLERLPSESGGCPEEGVDP
ncbi:DTW domain-containing protein [Halopseudomonas nanhaiensis]|uniref:tRNA-uridine aminocarboxypropyltransferase n=1 Tax=Halopseudomonas nanhaiensis TaxID=2830842 RepID=UPI001CBB1D7F|nr:DTW domain-containing protein [Halopseudomonas nanhaiensis]UAW97462.1 DTW domain-containing protein [Halopseudomonas nanhaiensis]